jgi:subtilisin family serine protease
VRKRSSIYKALIGLLPAEFDSARDDNGHGTHTTSTAAGNAGVAASIYGIPRGAISGLAPRAYVSAYRACAAEGCYTSDTVAAIDQAVADGVDVINYSIGGGPGQPGADEIAFLFAADAGLFVATSAGNAGSGPGTVGNPSTMPWLTSVGASTQTRFWEGSITLGNGAVYTGDDHPRHQCCRWWMLLITAMSCAIQPRRSPGMLPARLCYVCAAPLAVRRRATPCLPPVGRA